MASGSAPTKKVEASASTTPPVADALPKYNLAADFLTSAFNRYHDAKRQLASGNKEQSKILKTKAMKLLLSAMETPGISELMFAFNRLNTAAALPEELEDDDGIDPESWSELDLSDFESDDADEDENTGNNTNETRPQSDDEIDDGDTDDDDQEDDAADDDDGDDDDSDDLDDDGIGEEEIDANLDSSTGETRAQLAMANALSFSGQDSERRIAAELLTSTSPKSAKE